MLRYIPDWVFYTLALFAILLGVFGFSPDQDAPPATPDSIEREGATLPPPSAFDERVLVQVTAPKDGIGTAFSINTDGYWMTARHVVDGCSDVSLLVAPNRYLPVQDVSVSDTNDLALLFRVGDAGQAAEEQVFGVGADDLDAHVLGEHGHDLITFLMTQQAVIDEDAGQLVANGLVQQRGNDR